MTPEALIAQLETEVVQGWPKPWHPQDIDASLTELRSEPSFEQQANLAAYLDLIAGLLTDLSNGEHGNFGPSYHRNNRRREIRSRKDAA